MVGRRLLARDPSQECGLQYPFHFPQMAKSRLASLAKGESLESQSLNPHVLKLGPPAIGAFYNFLFGGGFPQLSALYHLFFGGGFPYSKIDYGKKLVHLF